MCLRLLIIWALLPVLAQAEGSLVRSGAFEVISLAGDDAARRVLNQLEQFQHALGWVLNRQALEPPQPVRVAVARPGSMPTEPFLRLGREGMLGLLYSGRPVPPEWWKALGRILLESAGKAPLPRDIEEGLLDLFSTLRIEGLTVELGAPPALERRTEAWAALHRLATDPVTAGRLRVLLSNLCNGTPLETALWNSLRWKPEQWSREAKQYLTAEQYPVARLPAKPVNPRRDYFVREVSREAEKLLLADLLLASDVAVTSARVAYREILNSSGPSAAALEGYGLACLAEGDEEAAMDAFRKVRQSGAMSPRVAVEYARRETDAAQAVEALEASARSHPGAAEIYAEMARRAPSMRARVQLLAKAAELAPRRVDFWKNLARAAADAGDAVEAARAWSAALAAVSDTAEREAILRERAAAEQARLDQLAEQRRRKQEEERAQLEQLKREMEERIRAAEERVRREAAAEGAGVKGEILPWWEGPTGQKVSGRLAEVVCENKRAILVLETIDGRLMRLLVEDFASLPVGESAPRVLKCGVQNPKPTVAVTYLDRQDGDTNTQGVVQGIQY